MTLTLEQWKEILDTVNPDKGDILKQIKENLKKDHDRIYKIFKIKDFGINDEFPLESRRVSLLHIAASNGKSKIVEYLICKGVDVNVRDHNDNTPLHLAARYGHSKIVACLINKRAKVDITNNYGDIPLHDAASNGYLDIVQALLEQPGVNVDVKNNYGNTLLHLAARNGHSKLVAYLIGKKAKVNITNDYDDTPLHDAASNGYLDIVQALLEQPGVNVDVKNNYGNTPLHWAARNGHSEVVAYLISKRAKVDITNDYGETALHWAAFKGRKDVVIALFSKGANPLIKSKDGKTPRDLTNDENIIQLLKEAETKHIISKSIMIGSVCGVVAALAAGGGCFAVDVALPMLALIGIAVSAALVIGAIAGGISHVVLRPSDDECLSKPQKSVVNSPKSQNKVQSQISDQEPKMVLSQVLSHL